MQTKHLVRPDLGGLTRIAVNDIAETLFFGIPEFLEAPARADGKSAIRPSGRHIPSLL